MSAAEPMARLRKLIEPVVEAHGLELVDLRMGAGRLSVFLDKDGGIGVDECARMSRTLGDVLDTENAIPGRYVLEVSSPGLDRPLKTARDFARRIGKKVRILWREAEGLQRDPLAGIIQQCRDDTVILQVDERTVEVALDDIDHGQLVAEFG